MYVLTDVIEFSFPNKYTIVLCKHGRTKIRIRNTSETVIIIATVIKLKVIKIRGVIKLLSERCVEKRARTDACVSAK